MIAADRSAHVREARGAEMLSAMLGFGIVSRIGSGLVADRLGGPATLLIGSLLQGIALFLYLLFDGLVSLYISRRCSGCSKAASCRCMRSSCGSIFRRGKLASASGSF